MNHYFIRGTIQICVGESTAKTTIKISPSAGFLAPDVSKEETSIGIALPDDYKTSAKPDDAKLLKSTITGLECDATTLTKHLSTLVEIAAQQKPVELHLKAEKDSGEMRIVGFVFPTK